MLKVRAKFKCNSILENEHTHQWDMSPVSHNDDPEHENSQYWKYSPNGSFKISVDKKAYQGDHPVIGKEYYLDISEAPE